MRKLAGWWGWRRRWLAAHRRSRVAVLVGAVFMVGMLAGLSAVEARARTRDDAFDFVAWEIRSVANKWLFAIGAPLRDDPPPDVAIARYFSLADRDGPEAVRLENVVEAAIEGRIHAAARDLDVGAPPLPLPDALLGPLAVFPPVDIELSIAPRVLVVSPRDAIRRQRTDLLRLDLTLDEAVLLEVQAEAADPAVAAVVLRTGGIATFPAVAEHRRSYATTVATAAHEWTHHHLSLYPLGRAVFGSAAARTINETVADIVGDELGAHALRLFGEPTAPAPDPPTAPPAVDRDAVLRELRREVDALLLAGRVEQAERRMEQVRLELWDAGVRIRRINQAYFAWFGSYATRPDATDPLGSQLQELRARAGTLERFLDTARDLTSRAAVEAALEELRDAQDAGGS